ncbi:MAG: SDR family oxidoreductase [Micromonosporaceae bacterium]|nr:SDR family oxidoreductase [Micromonosporaceae bacterium]
MTGPDPHPPTRGIALVTGGGTGIGRAVALALAGRGHAVVVTGRRSEPLDETVHQIRDAGGRGEAVRLDVRDAEGIGTLLDRLRRTDRIDVVVANAGSFVRGPVAELDPRDWTSQVEVNLTGAFLTLQAAVRAMRDQEPVDGCRGHLFTVNSGAGVAGFPTGAAYAAAKHGLRGLVESLRPEVAPLAIKVTDIVVAATVASEMNAARDVPKLPASVVGHTVLSCLALPGAANWDRVDLTQLPT